MQGLRTARPDGNLRQPLVEIVTHREALRRDGDTLVHGRQSAAQFLLRIPPAAFHRHITDSALARCVAGQLELDAPGFLAASGDAAATHRLIPFSLAARGPGLSLPAR